MTKFVYGLSTDAWDDYRRILQDFGQSAAGNSWCEVGGGANPEFDSVEIRNMGLNYSIVDISENELRKAPPDVGKICSDISGGEADFGGEYDLVFSKMLFEHLIDAHQAHKNIHKGLKYGAYAVHFFPTLYALPFLVNRLIPESVSRFILMQLAPRDTYQHGKFPAYYRECRGPLKGQLRMLEELGYEIVEYRSYFGHEGYYTRLGFLRSLHRIWSRYLCRTRSIVFSSFAIVILRRNTV